MSDTKIQELNENEIENLGENEIEVSVYYDNGNLYQGPYVNILVKYSEEEDELLEQVSDMKDMFSGSIDVPICPNTTLYIARVDFDTWGELLYHQSFDTFEKAHDMFLRIYFDYNKRLPFVTTGITTSMREDGYFPKELPEKFATIPKNKKLIKSIEANFTQKGDIFAFIIENENVVFSNILY